MWGLKVIDISGFINNNDSHLFNNYYRYGTAFF